MKIIHFFPHNSEAIGFFNRVKRHLKMNYKPYYELSINVSHFCRVLSNRLDYTDVIIITAHGSKHCIYGDIYRGELRELTVEQLKMCKNSFIFAFSCSTSELGRQLCENYNIMSYIGFNKDISLTVESSKKQFSEELSNILKEIYTCAVNKAFDRFIRENLNIDQFARMVSKCLLEYHTMVMTMNDEQLITNFRISRKKVKDNPLFKKALGTDLIGTVNYVRELIEIHGEKYFIPWMFIESENKNFLRQLINKVKNSTFKEENLYYKNFLLAILYKKCGAEILANYYLLQTKKLNIDYKPVDKLLPTNKKITGKYLR